MSVELNEFTEDQLQFAIDMFIDKTDDINRSLQRLEDFPDGEVRKDLKAVYDVEFDTALLWKVQLMNALDEVKAGNKIVNS